MNGKILIVYYHDLGFPLRATSQSALQCFRRYSNHLCYYVNAAFGIPHYLKDVEFDLIIFHNLLISKRSLLKRFYRFMHHCQTLKTFQGTKIAMAQDEYLNTDVLCEFINNFDIKHMFSLAEPSEWPKIYPTVDFMKVHFHRVLTGYLDEETITLVNELMKKDIHRSIDIGYRANKIPYSLGRQGLLKIEIAEIFKQKAAEQNLQIDISTNPQDTFLGNGWFVFLLKCKYVLGVEGGASLLDKNGDIMKKVVDFSLKHPKATFAETEQACFPGLDGNLLFRPISPRHFEACLTRTCQVLYEGSYDNVLKPGIHYIELKKGYRNINEVLDMIKNDKYRAQITGQAYHDIIENQKYTYRAFVEQVLAESLEQNHAWTNISKKDEFCYEKNCRREERIWQYIPIRSFMIKNVLDRIPNRWYWKLFQLNN